MKICKRCHTVLEDDEPICPECFCRAFTYLGEKK